MPSPTVDGARTLCDQDSPGPLSGFTVQQGGRPRAARVAVQNHRLRGRDLAGEAQESYLLHSRKEVREGFPEEGTYELRLELPIGAR